ncbi:MAG: sigma-54-dependent Fis family transcriptional regulator [Deltaproteobacteria bacterium]|nr:sigma-54-dependent Fis family transcriptional regulator [Deltaproteobacteria bacterium]
MALKKIVVIDDEEAMRHLLGVILKREGYEPVMYADAREALCALESGDFILCDIRMPGMGGLEFLEAVKAGGVSCTVIMMSAYGTVDTAIECMKHGAYDYISKPFKADEVSLTIKKAEERERLKRENSRLLGALGKGFEGIITVDKAMIETVALAKKVAGYDAAVLIVGESGTGKELIARALHFGGARKDRPFVAINCGAMPAQLIESELFGHVKGAFTDAHRTKTGLFQEADTGTLFLDEVGELPMELQVKLLRTLQEGEVRRVGDTKAIKVDTRVVAATAKDLKQAIVDGLFREDLYFRLNVIEIRLPPLRARSADIALLATHFIEKYGARFGKKVKGITDEAYALLKSYDWPGNVRELENVIERAMILEDTGWITPDALPISARFGAQTRGAATSSALSIKKAHQIIERALIKRALEATGNNKTKAAELLEISFRALLYKIKDYGL